MEPSLHDDERIRLYLLGALPKEEQTQFEERLMTDDEFFDRLLVAEDELIDDYVRGHLSQTDRGRFEAHFLSTPERRRQLSFARTFDLYVSKKDIPIVTPVPDPSPWWSSLLFFFRSGNPAMSLAFAAAALLLAAGGTWLVFKALRTGQPPAETRVDQKGSEPTVEPGAPVPQPTPQDKVAEDRKPEPSPPQTDRPQPTPPERSPSPALRIAAIVSTGGVRSGGETSRIAPEPGEKAVRVQLNLDEDTYQSYRAEIKNIDIQGNLPPQDRLKAVNAGSRKAVFLRILLDRYPPGDYQVTLKGLNANGELEDAGTYTFRILRRK